MRSSSQMCALCRQELEEYLDESWQASVAEDAWGRAA
jgi:hypothetical protein